jgi:hypothetical protein
MPSTTLVHAIQEAIHTMEHELMLVDAIMTDNATAEIIKDTGTRLTIRIPGGLLPVHLTVDPPGAARLVRLLDEYAKKAPTIHPAASSREG